MKITNFVIVHPSDLRHSHFEGALMFLARVTGHVVATQKDKTLNGQKLFVVEPLNVKYDEATKQPASLGNTGRAIVAIDVGRLRRRAARAGRAGLSSARMTEQTKNLPADAVIVGIVDSAEYRGEDVLSSGTEIARGLNQPSKRTKSTRPCVAHESSTRTRRRRGSDEAARQATETAAACACGNRTGVRAGEDRAAKNRRARGDYAHPHRIDVPIGQYGIFANVDDAVAAATEAQKKLVAAVARRPRRDRQAHQVDGQGKRPGLGQDGAGRDEDRPARSQDRESCRSSNWCPASSFSRPTPTAAATASASKSSPPFGVIGVITPVTHSVPTLTANAINMIAAGNAIVANPHPSGDELRRPRGARIQQGDRREVRHRPPDHLHRPADAGDGRADLQPPRHPAAGGDRRPRGRPRGAGGEEAGDRRRARQSAGRRR